MSARAKARPALRVKRAYEPVAGPFLSLSFAAAEMED